MSKDFSFKNSNYSSADRTKYPNEDARFERLESKHNTLSSDFDSLEATVENIPTQISTLTAGKSDKTYVDNLFAAINAANATINDIVKSATCTTSYATINSKTGNVFNVTYSSGGYILIPANISEGKKYVCWIVFPSTYTDNISMHIKRNNGTWVQDVQFLNYGYTTRATITCTATTSSSHLCIVSDYNITNAVDIKIFIWDVTNDAELETILYSPNGYFRDKTPRYLPSPVLKQPWFYNKIGCIMGDSITEQALYTNDLKMAIGIPALYRATVAGTSVAGTDANAFHQDVRVNALETTAQIIGIFGGTNDSAAARTVGTVALTNYDTTTFVGAYNVLISKILYKYYVLSSGYYASSGVSYSGVNKIASARNNLFLFLITPPYASGSTYSTNMEAIVDAIVKVGKLWGLPVIDLYRNSGINAINASFCLTDEVHPNAFGGKKIASTIASGLLQYEPISTY